MSLDQFKKFSSYREKVEVIREEVWSYTRVSSKEQFDNNNSLKNQKNHSLKYVKDNDFNLTFEFGGTYESAKGDFTRKEFKNMIAEVRKAKKKPFAIMIFKMSRFSRSGSGGISVVHELVDGLGVHLIETSSGNSTITPRGKNTILTKLVDAERENIERLEITVPGMKNFLKEGNWLGNAPNGYDHHGPRVKDISRLSHKQKLVLNDDGKLLQKAWQWKLEGQRDFEIIQKLDLLGLKISKQKLSDMWRKTFYCGVNTHKMLEGMAIIGNWEPMVSQTDFLRVQSILDNNNVGYKVSAINENRPLTGFVTCFCCGNKLTSYEVKTKGLHYYTCQKKCEGSTMNAISSAKSKKVGMNDLFCELLGSFQLDENLVPLFIQQLSNTLKAFNSDNFDIEKRLNKDISILKENKETLERKFIFESLPKTIYDKYMNEIEDDILKKTQELQKSSLTISNQNDVIEKCVSIARNLSNYWFCSDINLKLRIQKMIFPEGLVIDAKNRQYLTNNVNLIFGKIPYLSKDTEGQKKDASSNLPDASCLVAGTRLERATFGL
jgi:site-specific DNA recombinase